LISPTIMF